MRSVLLAGALIAAFGLAGCDETSPGMSQPGPLPDGRAGETVRPIEDFLSAQGTFCLPDGGGGCILFVPPLDNFLGWNDPTNGYAASIDYAGIADEWLIDETGGAMSLGTTFDGTVVERTLPDGRAEVRVVLQTFNALTWVSTDFDFTTPLVFGARVTDVLAGATPALGRCTFEVEFTNTAPGAPLPDIMKLLIAPDPGQQLLGAVFTTNVSGELREAFGLPDGTQGRVFVTQRGLVDIPGQGEGVADGFPAEFIKIRPIGQPSH